MFPMHRAFFELFKIKVKEIAPPVRMCPICGDPIPYSANAMKACSAKCRSERKRRMAMDRYRSKFEKGAPPFNESNHVTEEGAENDNAEGV